MREGSRSDSDLNCDDEREWELESPVQARAGSSPFSFVLYGGFVSGATRGEQSWKIKSALDNILITRSREKNDLNQATKISGMYVYPIQSEQGNRG